MVNRQDLTTEQELRTEIVRVGQLMHQKGFVAATDGNISVRWGNERLLVTPSGVSKGFMRPEEISVTDLEGHPLDNGTAGDHASQPSSELRLHLEAYRQRPDIRAVIHAHPPLATAFTVAGLSLEPCVIPEVVTVLGTIPTARYATPTTAEGPEMIRELIRTRDALLLDHHGALTVGKTIFEAYLKLEKVEHTAQIILTARQLGKVTLLSPEQVDKLVAIRKEHGWYQNGDEEAFRRAYRAALTAESPLATTEELSSLIARLVAQELDKRLS